LKPSIENAHAPSSKAIARTTRLPAKARAPQNQMIGCGASREQAITRFSNAYGTITRRVGAGGGEQFLLQFSDVHTNPVFQTASCGSGTDIVFGQFSQNFSHFGTRPKRAHFHQRAPTSRSARRFP